MAITSVQEFLQASVQRDNTNEAFELENPYMLEARVNGRVWAKVGAMVATTGNVTFTRQSLGEQGLLRLAGETFFANGNDVLAYQDGVQTQITMMRRMSAMLAGGLFNIRLSGSGVVAITSHYEPLTLPVTRAGGPVYTDPNATVAWSGSLSPDFVSNVTLGTFFGRGSGEAFRMKFEGEGWVVVQPYEEITMQRSH
jgi:uncharacterized protein (AIM24 family)